MKRNLVSVLATFGILTLSACRNTVKVPIVTSFIPASSDSITTESKSKDNVEFITYQGKQWLLSTPDSHKVPKKYGEFNNDKILTDWFKLNSSTSQDPNQLIKVRFNVVDIIMGKTEGNYVYHQPNKKIYMPLSIVRSEDPGLSGSRYGEGKENAGPASVNCFEDRPADQILRPICKTLFKGVNSSIEQFAQMDSDAKMDTFYKMQAGIYLGNYYQSVLRKNSQLAISNLNKTGLSNLSTSMKIIVTDQSNQLGLGGSTKLMRIYKSLLGLNHAKILARLKAIGVSNNDGVFINGYGEPIDLKSIPEPFLRIAYARVLYHNNKGTLTTFVSSDSWLTRAANSWTYASVKKDNPNLKQDIKASITTAYGDQDWDALQYKGSAVGADKIEVKVTKGDQILYKAQYPIGSGRVYKPEQVAFGDIIRRIGSIPQSQQEFDELSKASKDFLQNEYYQHWGLKP